MFFFYFALLSLFKSNFVTHNNAFIVLFKTLILQDLFWCQPNRFYIFSLCTNMFISDYNDVQLK